MIANVSIEGHHQRLTGSVMAKPLQRGNAGRYELLHLLRAGMIQIHRIKHADAMKDAFDLYGRSARNDQQQPRNLLCLDDGRNLRECSDRSDNSDYRGGACQCG